MLETDPAPEPQPPPPALPTPPASPPMADRLAALFEVLACSDYPTQLALAGTFSALGYRAFDSQGRLAFGYVIGLSLADAGLLIGLMLLFMAARGERPRDIFLGPRRPVVELLAGIPLVFGALAVGAVVLATARLVAPWTHTVPHNPLQDLLTSRSHAWVFALVVVVAGGIREELQRAFLLHRFEHRLGGARVGVVVTSLAFGGGHLLQGADAALATAALGAWWALLYLRRRSVLGPIVSHSGFDLVQILGFFMLGR